MSGFLLDTNAAIFALALPEKLSATARRAIVKGPNTLSVVSYWEVMLKSMKGTLDVGDPRAWWQEALEQLAATPLTLRAEHITAVQTLPSHHKDPFDRVLIAQAAQEGFTLVSTDAEMARYASSSLKILR